MISVPQGRAGSSDPGSGRRVGRAVSGARALEGGSSTPALTPTTTLIEAVNKQHRRAARRPDSRLPTGSCQMVRYFR